MSRQIRMSAGRVRLTATLNDGASADALWEALPITGRANTWGDEVYFAIPVEDDLAPDARADMQVGELAYWPPGQAFCVFFGPTPASTSDQPRAASKVNPLGRIDGDAAAMRDVRDGEEVTLERVE